MHAPNVSCRWARSPGPGTVRAASTRQSAVARTHASPAELVLCSHVPTNRPAVSSVVTTMRNRAVVGAGKASTCTRVSWRPRTSTVHAPRRSSGRSGHTADHGVGEELRPVLGQAEGPRAVVGDGAHLLELLRRQ